MTAQLFLCDQMLGSLARWLRMLGFDTYYATDQFTDDQLLQIAAQQKRILITRDKELLIRAKKQKIPTIAITTTDVEQQREQVLSHLQHTDETVLSRCLLCNTMLRRIEKERVKEQVPKRIYESHDLFWYCPNCDKYYWKGTHYDDMKQKIEKYHC